MAGGMQWVELEQFSETAGNHPYGRGRKQREKQFLVFYIGYSRKPAVKLRDISIEAMGCENVISDMPCIVNG